MSKPRATDHRQSAEELRQDLLEAMEEKLAQAKKSGAVQIGQAHMEAIVRDLRELARRDGRTTE